ncbi:MAG: hypothetical protein AB3N12_04860 [Ruegeria sp.]
MSSLKRIAYQVMSNIVSGALWGGKDVRRKSDKKRPTPYDDAGVMLG